MLPSGATVAMRPAHGARRRADRPASADPARAPSAAALLTRPACGPGRHALSRTDAPRRHADLLAGRRAADGCHQGMGLPALAAQVDRPVRTRPVRRPRAAGHRARNSRPGRFAHLLLRARRSRAADFVPRPHRRHDATSRLWSPSGTACKPQPTPSPASSCSRFAAATTCSANCARGRRRCCGRARRTTVLRWSWNCRTRRRPGRSSRDLPPIPPPPASPRAAAKPPQPPPTAAPRSPESADSCRRRNPRWKAFFPRSRVPGRRSRISNPATSIS